MSAFQLQPGEKVILKARRHWLTFLSESIGLVLALFIPLAVITFFDVEQVARTIFATEEQINALISFHFAAWTFLLFMLFSVIFSNYYLDIFMVTNRRVVDIEQLGLFARDIAIAPLENIEDIKIEIIGLIPTLFKYGTLHVQTAATNREITIKGIVRPHKVKHAILAMKDDISTRVRD